MSSSLVNAAVGVALAAYVDAKYSVGNDLYLGKNLYGSNWE